jgi:hypothetical protein
MTKQEALELLDLEENSSNEKIERSYKQLFSEYRLRLDNAPTPHLKALYQKNLKRLEEAYELLRVKEPENEILDLPTVTPLLQIEKEPKISVPKLETETQKKDGLKTDKNERKVLKKGIIASLLFILLIAIVFIVTTKLKGNNATLLIMSREHGIIKIDGDEKGKVKKDELLKIELKAGHYIVQFYPENGSKSETREVELFSGKKEKLSFNVVTQDEGSSKTKNTDLDSILENSKSKNKTTEELSRKEEAGLAAQKKEENERLAAQKREENERLAAQGQAKHLYITVNGKKIEVAKNDLGEMNWHDAKKACEKLGNGWRLPTEEEMSEMYSQLFKNRRGNFIDGEYWGSTSSCRFTFLAMWFFPFGDGNVNNNDYTVNKNTLNYVRAVRAF